MNMLKRWILSLALVAAVGGSFSCGQCAIYCGKLQKLVFRDASGAPLTPLKVTDGTTEHTCALPDGGVASTFVTCTQDELTYDLRSLAPRTIRAEATTGQVFQGTITPEFIPSSRPATSCSCGDDTLKPITLQLAAP